MPATVVALGAETVVHALTFRMATYVSVRKITLENSVKVSFTHVHMHTLERKYATFSSTNNTHLSALYIYIYL